jgi:hypothetical protein
MSNQFQSLSLFAKPWDAVTDVGTKQGDVPVARSASSRTSAAPM